MDEEFVSVLIVAKPGRLREGLAALVSAIPYVDKIYQESSLFSASQKIVQYKPYLVILDSNNPRINIEKVLITLKSENCQAIYVVLADDVNHEKAAIEAGADAVLLKGFPAEKLIQTLNALLAGRFPYYQQIASSPLG